MTGTDMTGTERMYGVGRALDDFYKSLPPGTVITREIEYEAFAAAIRWLRAHPLKEPGLEHIMDAIRRALPETPDTSDAPETPENAPHAAHG